jgi:hypothetical protein
MPVPKGKTHLQRASGLSRIARAQCSIAIALAYACTIPLYPYAIAKFGLIEGALAEEEQVSSCARRFGSNRTRAIRTLSRR